jgi:hypothetical protein
MALHAVVNPDRLSAPWLIEGRVLKQSAQVLLIPSALFTTALTFKHPFPRKSYGHGEENTIRRTVAMLTMGAAIGAIGMFGPELARLTVE